MASDFEDSFDNDITNRSPGRGPNPGEGDKKLSFFSLAYFQQYFDVDTNIVRERIISLSKYLQQINCLTVIWNSNYFIF